MKSNPINVLFVEENQDGTIGGSHYCLLDLVKELDKEQFEPLVMFYEYNRLTDEFKKTGAQVVIYHRHLGIDLSKKFSNTALDFLTHFHILLRILQVIFNGINTSLIPLIYFIYFILKHNVHIIHINNSVFVGLEWVLAAKLTGRKIIAHQRGYYNEIPSYCRFHSSRYDYILGTSKDIRENLYNLGINITNYSTFYDRIDIDEFRGRLSKTSEEIRKEFSLEKDQPLIGIVGNLQRWKGQMTVVEAIKLLHPKYPNIKCLFIGDLSNKAKDDINYYHELTEKIRLYNLDSNIVLTGYRSDITDILNALDVFIHASIDPEPYGLVVLEAMAMGKAIIASRKGGPAEMIINGESGILIEPGNPQILAEKIDLLLSNKRLRRTFGKNAFKRVKEKFSRIDIKKIEDIYKTLAKK